MRGILKKVQTRRAQSVDKKERGAGPMKGKQLAALQRRAALLLLNYLLIEPCQSLMKFVATRGSYTGSVTPFLRPISMHFKSHAIFSPSVRMV